MKDETRLKALEQISAALEALLKDMPSAAVSRLRRAIEIIEVVRVAEVSKRVHGNDYRVVSRGGCTWAGVALQ